MKKIFTLFAGIALAMSASAEVSMWVAPEEAPEAGATIVDDALITANTVFATKISAVGAENPQDLLDFNGATYSKRMDVRVDAAPTEAIPTGTDKGNATPIVITTKKDVAITFYYRRQLVDGAATAGDGKDLKVCDQAAPKTMLPGELTLIKDIDGSYANVSQKFTLAAGKTFTVFGRGTTIGMFLFTYEEGEAGGNTGGGDDPVTPPTPGDNDDALFSATCPANAIAYWYNPTGAADYVAPVGTFNAGDDAGVNVNYANGDYMTMRINGKHSNGDVSVEVVPSQPIAEGDVIVVKAYRNKDTNAGASLALTFNTGTTAVLGEANDGTGFNNIYDGLQPNALAYTCTAAEAGAVNIAISREKASTNVFIVGFQLTKGAPEIAGIGSVSVDSIDAPVYNMLGQKVDASYKGIVVKNGVKFIQK